MYGFETQAVAEAQSMRLYGVKDRGSPYPWAASPLEAFKRHIQEHGPQRSDRSLYAVSHATANRLWSWGRAVAVEVKAQAVPAHSVQTPNSGKKERYDWKGKPELFAKLSKDFESAPGVTAKEKREHVGTEWGLSPIMVKKMLAKGKKTASKENKPRSHWD